VFVLKRKFFSAVNKCSSGCGYCFAKWDNYTKYPHFSCESINENDLIVYPCCDGNIFDDSFDKLLAEALKVKNRVFLSISTKNDISEERMNKLVEINNLLKSHNNGFLKLSLSFSCLSIIDIIEKNTLPFDKRLSLIKDIIDRGLTYVTIIKPILPFIQKEEYKSVIDNTVNLSKNYIIGGLYVNKNTDFYKEYNLEKYPAYEKPVSWLPNNEKWLYIEDEAMKKYICGYIADNKGIFYNSDADFFSSFIT